MKFIVYAIGSLLASSCLVKGDRATNVLDKKRLLRNAIPYDRTRQMADQDDVYLYSEDSNVFDYFDAKYGNKQIDDETYPQANIYPTDSVKFKSCINIETEDYDLLLDNIVGYAKKNIVSSTRSYVLFDLCESGNCATGTDNTFMVDLNTYIQATIDNGPAEREKTCEACQEYANTCNGRRKDRRLDEYATTNCTYVIFDENACDKCSEYDCWDNYNDDQSGAYEELEDWIVQNTECIQTGSQWKDFDLYQAWTCNEDGTGIEMGVFIDQYCRMQQKQFTFEDDRIEQSQDIIDMMFNKPISCQDDDWYYLDFDSAVAMTYGECVAYVDDISEACGMLFYSDFVPRKISNCGTTQNITKLLYQSGDEDFVEYDEARKDLYSRQERKIKWYTFDLSADDALDGASTCKAVSSVYEQSKSLGSGIWKWLVFVAGMAVGFFGAVYCGLHFQKRQKLKQVQDIEESVKKIPARDYRAMEDQMSPRREPVSPRSRSLLTDEERKEHLEDSKGEEHGISTALKVKKSFSKVRSLIQSKSFRKETEQVEDDMVILDATGGDEVMNVSEQ